METDSQKYAQTKKWSQSRRDDIQFITWFRRQRIFGSWIFRAIIRLSKQEISSSGPCIWRWRTNFYIRGNLNLITKSNSVFARLLLRPTVRWNRRASVVVFHKVLCIPDGWTWLQFSLNKQKCRISGICIVGKKLYKLKNTVFI